MENVTGQQYREPIPNVRRGNHVIAYVDNELKKYCHILKKLSNCVKLLLKPVGLAIINGKPVNNLFT
jgi:hypothetical protein